MISTVLALLLVMAVVAVASTVVALRSPIAFRVAMRNVRRGPWRTVLVVAGLLVGTTIISGSLVINDTVNAVNVHFAYQAYGSTDEGIYNSSVAQGNFAYAFFPESAYEAIANRTASDPQIVGTTPEIVTGGSIFDRTNGVPESGIQVVGVNASAGAALGAFAYDNGSSTPGPAAGGVLLDDQLAANLGATTGDRVVLYGATPIPLVVQGVVKDDLRGGFLGGNTAFVGLAAAQSLWNASGRINFIAVTNAGSLAQGLAESGAVTAQLNATLAALGSPAGLAAYPLLETAVNQAIRSGSSITTLFLVLGLFSIVAGALLIVGIFVTLAEERKGEMGMLRAVGLPRRALVHTYYFEGLVYAAASALAGTALGVAVGYVLLELYVRSASSLSPSIATAFAESFTASPQSLLTAYVAGFLLTLGTIAAASARVSRLNIVRAIRSVPEPTPPLRLYTWLAYAGGALVALGGLLFAATRGGTGDVNSPLIGLGLAIAGAGLVASRFVPNRAAFSVTGILLIAWAGTTSLHRLVLGSQHSGTILAIFVEGIQMVVGAVLLFVFNSDLLVRGIGRLAGHRGRAVPVVRVGLAYPRRRPLRSAVNFMIFVMVIFTVVVVASYGAAVQQGLDNSVTAESGGYTFFGFTSVPVPGLPGAIANNSTLAGEFSTVVPLVVGTVAATLPGVTGPWEDSLYAAPANASAAQNFYSTNRYNFTATLGGMPASTVWHELATNASVAVVDGAYQPGGVTFGGSHPSVSLGAVVPLENPATHVARSVTVIGYMSETFLGGFWVNPSTAASLGYSGEAGFLLTTAPTVSATTAAQDLKRAFYPEGLVLFDFAQILASSVQTVEGIIGLLEVFVGLGLAVGIAGMGIVALRAVVERRTQIGMLRANGFTRGMVLAAFLVEYSYVTLLGTGVGTALALWLYYNATAANAGTPFGVFVIPGTTIATILLVAYALTLLAIVGPSWRAARLPPAEAVRYTE